MSRSPSPAGDKLAVHKIGPGTKEAFEEGGTHDVRTRLIRHEDVLERAGETRSSTARADAIRTGAARDGQAQVPIDSRAYFIDGGYPEASIREIVTRIPESHLSSEQKELILEGLVGRRKLIEGALKSRLETTKT